MILLARWRDPMLPADARLEAAVEEIKRLNKERTALRVTLRNQIMTYQVDDQAWDREMDADRIMTRLLKDL